MSRQEKDLNPSSSAVKHEDQHTADGAEKQNDKYIDIANEQVPLHAGIVRRKKRKPWPKECVWPEPIWDGEGDMQWEPDDAAALPVDSAIDELVSIREYMDKLVEEGILNEDYSLNLEYEPEEDSGWNSDCDIGNERSTEPDESDSDDEDDERDIPFDIQAFEPER